MVKNSKISEFTFLKAWSPLVWAELRLRWIPVYLDVYNNRNMNGDPGVRAEEDGGTHLPHLQHSVKERGNLLSYTGHPVAGYTEIPDNPVGNDA